MDLASKARLEQSLTSAYWQSINSLASLAYERDGNPDSISQEYQCQKSDNHGDSQRNKKDKPSLLHLQIAGQIGGEDQSRALVGAFPLLQFPVLFEAKPTTCRGTIT